MSALCAPPRDMLVAQLNGLPDIGPGIRNPFHSARLSARKSLVSRQTQWGSLEGALGALEERLADLLADRRVIIGTAKSRDRKSLDDVETVEFRRASAEIQELRECTAEVKEERERKSALDNAAYSLYTGSGSRDGNSADIGKRWAQDAATALHKLSGDPAP